jgi:hypothetical protein
MLMLAEAFCFISSVPLQTIGQMKKNEKNEQPSASDKATDRSLCGWKEDLRILTFQNSIFCLCRAH